MPSIPVVNIDGKKVESLELPEDIFGVEINQDILHQALMMYQAGQRQGNASTKERGAVSGGGKKPWRQKGTGRARAGSIRSPLWKGGGVVFGPHPRDFSYSIPKSIRLGALRESLNAKFVSNDLTCIDELKTKTPKTKDFAKALTHLKLEGRVLAVAEKSDDMLQRVTRNIPFFNLMRAQDVNAYDILRNKKLLVTKDAFKNLLKRIK